MPDHVSNATFAAFIPGAVREYAAHRLIQLRYIDDLPDNTTEYGDSRPIYQREIWRKLVTDDRMAQVYSSLTLISNNPKRWFQFLEAGVHARDDFQYERQDLKDAIALKPSLTKTLSILKAQLRQINEIADATDGKTPVFDVNWPSELFELSLFVSRQETDDPPWITRLVPFCLWKQEDSARALEVDPESNINTSDNNIYVLSLPAVVDELARALADWEPAAGHSSGSAQTVLKSQNRTSGRTQFIRSFWHLLTEANLVHAMPDETFNSDTYFSSRKGWSRSSPVLSAIASISEIIRDDPDEVIDQSVVRDALDFLSNEG